MYLKSRPRVRSGIERAERKTFPQHLQWVRRLSCSVPGCEERQIEAHHVREGEFSGISAKPHDRNAVPLCALHHAEGHQIGWKTFEAKYAVNLRAVADACARQSTQKHRWEE